MSGYEETGLTEQQELVVSIMCVCASLFTAGLAAGTGNLFGCIAMLGVAVLCWGWLFTVMRDHYQRRNPWRRSKGS